MDAADLIKQYKSGKRDFRGINQHEQSLIGAHLADSRFQSANFTVANLSSANLSHCNLSEANFNVARLSGANLGHSQLFRTSLNVSNLIRTVLTGANLTESTLIRAEAMRCEMSNAILRRANLSESDFRESQIRWSDFSEANLNNIDFRKSSLVGSRFSQAMLQSANLNRADLRSAILQDADLKHATLRRADLSGANLRGANLRWADLRGANLSSADLTGAKLSGAKLLKTNFQGADLSDTSFIHADLSYANLMHAQWSRANLTEATLTGVRLYGSSRFHIVTHDLMCAWVDLSPEGEESETKTFHSDQEIHQFFNREQPAVTVLIDSPLSLQSNAALAKLYGKLAHYVDVVAAPPSIEVNQRKTKITFHVTKDINLFAMAYFSTLPFTAGRMLQRHLLMITSMLQTYDVSRLPDRHQQHLIRLNQTMVTLCHLFPHQPAIDHSRFGKAAELFSKPVQVEVTNSRGQALTLYHSPAFGVRNLARLEAEFPMPSEEDLSPAPSLENLIDFLVSMQTPALSIRSAS